MFAETYTVDHRLVIVHIDGQNSSLSVICGAYLCVRGIFGTVRAR